MKKILILNGANLNMLGMREPEIYGSDTLLDIRGLCTDKAKEIGVEIDFRQSNHEGVIIDWVQEAVTDFDGVIINAAAYTHTSIAIHDALKLLSCPIIEVHISNPSKRENFRHISYIEMVANHVIKGHGAKGYVMALDKISNILQ